MTSTEVILLLENEPEDWNDCIPMDTEAFLSEYLGQPYYCIPALHFDTNFLGVVITKCDDGYLAIPYAEILPDEGWEQLKTKHAYILSEENIQNLLGDICGTIDTLKHAEAFLEEALTKEQGAQADPNFALRAKRELQHLAHQ